MLDFGQLFFELLLHLFTALFRVLLKHIANEDECQLAACLPQAAAPTESRRATPKQVRDRFVKGE